MGGFFSIFLCNARIRTSGGEKFVECAEDTLTLDTLAERSEFFNWLGIDSSSRNYDAPLAYSTNFSPPLVVKIVS